MLENDTSCSRISDGRICRDCESSNVVKNGTTKNKKQQYHCKGCNKRFICHFTYRAYFPEVNQNIILLTKEGLGIRSTARVLKISVTTLLKRLLLIARSIRQPSVSLGKVYEVDEMRTFIKRKSKPMWIVCAFERLTKKVVAFAVGRRTNKTLSGVIKTLELAGAKKIYTDGLKNYRYVTSHDLHFVRPFGTNHIERMNLTLRTHLKRLNRKTICFSRSKAVLNAILKIYLWA